MMFRMFGPIVQKTLNEADMEIMVFDTVTEGRYTLQMVAMHQVINQPGDKSIFAEIYFRGTQASLSHLLMVEFEMKVSRHRSCLFVPST